MMKYFLNLFKSIKNKINKQKTLTPYSEIQRALIDLESKYQEKLIITRSDSERKRLLKEFNEDASALKQLWYITAIDLVTYYLRMMAYDINEDVKEIAIISLMSGYNEFETCAFIAMASMASEVKEDMYVTKLFRIGVHANAILEILKEYKDSGLIREELWKNYATAIYNIAIPSEHSLEWIEKILNDEIIKGKKLAVSRVNAKKEK